MNKHHNANFLKIMFKEPRIVFTVDKKFVECNPHSHLIKFWKKKSYLFQKLYEVLPIWITLPE